MKAGLGKRRLLGRGYVRDAEVTQEHAVIEQEDIGRLDVTMYDVDRMDGMQGGEQLNTDVQDLILWQRAAGEAVVEGLTLDVVHHVIVKAVGFAGIVDRHDVGVGELRQHPGFARETRCHVGRGYLRPENLDGDLALEGGILTQKDNAHTPCGDLALQGVTGR